MTPLNSTMCLKVKADTFCLPDLNGGVYFRNNSVSFRMEGEMIDRWIDMLLPMFTGEHTLEALTDGLPEMHRNRVYEIAETLYRNGFVRDVSQDRPHELSQGMLNKYASQIEFLDSLGDSGAYRFQSFRRKSVLAVGSGPMLLSLAGALLESGLPKLHVLITESAPTNRHRLAELADHARKTDPEIAWEEIRLPGSGSSAWQEAVRLYDAVLYVSQEGDVEELRQIHAACREEKKVFLPAVCVRQAGLAGPLVRPDSDGCWESAWRRLHASALSKDPQQHEYSTTAGAMLANAIAFEWLKEAAGVTDAGQNPKLFLLDLETLEGNWHTFLPHPLISRRLAETEHLQEVVLRLDRDSVQSNANALFNYMNRLTSAESGILHAWDEGDLKQLPLSQCRVQAADPLSEGPARLLPALIRSGLTHEEARREAGLAGLENYVSRLVSKTIPEEFVGVGAGENDAERVVRGLQKCLAHELAVRHADRHPCVFQVQPATMLDERCRYYWQTLNTIRQAPVIGLGEPVHGLPVVWVGASGRWYGCAHLNETLSLRKALQQAICENQNERECPDSGVLSVPATLVRVHESERLFLPACEEQEHASVLQSAMEALKRSGIRLVALDLALEPFLREGQMGVYGVLLREEASR